MKPQKKAVVARKATKMPTVAKKRRIFIERIMPDVRREKKSKKNDRTTEDPRKKMDNDKRKLEKMEERKKFDDKKRMEEKRKEHRSDKPDERKKQLGKDHEKKAENKTDEKRQTDKADDRANIDETNQENVDKKKLQKCEEKAKLDRQSVDNRKRLEKTEEKKKNVKLDSVDGASVEDNVKFFGTTNDKDALEDKMDILPPVTKKRGKDEKKKDANKSLKSDARSMPRSSNSGKDKKSERKKMPSEKDPASSKTSSAKTKQKDTRTKQGQQKKSVARKTSVLTKKSHLSVVKRLVDKKMDLARPIKDEEVSEDEGAVRKAKKKSGGIAGKSKVPQEKRPKLAKHMKAKLPQKHAKIGAVLKREDKLKTITEKIMARKKMNELRELSEETLTAEQKKNRDGSFLACQEQLELSNIKSEIEEDRDTDRSKEDGPPPPSKYQDNKKTVKSGGKVGGKVPKKSGKAAKVQMESNNQTSEDTSLGEDTNNKQCKVSEDSASSQGASSKQEQTGAEKALELDLKVEAMNGESASGGGVTSQSDSEGDSDDDYSKRGKQRDTKRDTKERASSPSDERARRMRLFGFWSGPKRHRVASLNALAKVHCLYENETGGVYLGGFCKPKPEKEKEKEKPRKMKEEKDEQPPRSSKEKERKMECKTEENVLKRKLRNVPGLRGKHWDMLESSSSSSSSSSDEDCEREKSAEPSKKKMTKRKRRNEEVMDLKDMVVCKRMASLNATAILAASYSDEKNRCGSSSDSSSESEVEIIKRRRQNDSDVDKKRGPRQGSNPEEVIKPSKKVVIVNQDTDVTITGVYVNQTRSTHHEGFCSIAGMQYRISSTSHTQTAATAVATELHDQQKPEQPCKSYTPLGALSSMQPPGSQGNHPNMSPRRHSAFSAPHQHGYYQPAGPLIQHPPPPPPSLPPVKGPPPEPTPTPPQNSEGSDDLVATSTTSGGTSSTGGGFYRTYCPQYYSTPPQYPDLCYPPTYSHPHAHPPHYYKYPPTFRRQFYGYQESGGGGGPPPGSGAAGGGPGVVDYQPPPPPPGEYPLPPYYGGYPPPPHPPPPPPNPAYLHSQGRPFVDPFQGCPCPMQSCPKNVDTGALIGNGKGAPVVSGPGLSLPPSALVGPPSPARGLAGLAPPHGANAWDTDRVQINTHRNLNQNQSPAVPPSHNLMSSGHNSRPQSQDCRSKEEQSCTDNTLRTCSKKMHCQSACTSTCEVKMETLSPIETKTVVVSPEGQYGSFKMENNNVKCESCSLDITDRLPCVANCNVVKYESDYKCDIMKCEQCIKEGQMDSISELDKDSGIVLDDKLESDPDVKEELDVVVIDNDNDESWKKPDYEPTVHEAVDDKEEKMPKAVSNVSLSMTTEQSEQQQQQPKCQKMTKRKLSLDSWSDSRKKRKLGGGKRPLSVGSSQDSSNDQPVPVTTPMEPLPSGSSGDHVRNDIVVPRKKPTKKDVRAQKRKTETPSRSENAPKKTKTTGKQQGIGGLQKQTASDDSIMQTIDNVVQQSVQMMLKREQRKSKNCEQRVERKKKSNAVKVEVAKKMPKRMDHVKEQSAQGKASKGGLIRGKASQDGKLKGKGGKSAKVATVAADVKATADAKSRAPETKAKKRCDASDVVSCKANTAVVAEGPKKIVIKKKRKTATKKATTSTKKSAGGCKPENSSSAGNDSLTLAKKSFLKPKWNNGWSWQGEPFEAKVYLTNEATAIRRCYMSMKHEDGDVLKPLDCVLLKSSTRKDDLPYVAKIAALWENSDDGEMMFSLLWYYRPEHTEQNRTPQDSDDEVFASRHRDANSVACIEDKCYILTFNEYCRYRKNLRRIEEGLENPGLIVPPGDQVYPRANRQPPLPVSSEAVLFCRRVYDYRGKKLMKNPA